VAFTALVLGNLVTIFLDRSRTRSVFAAFRVPNRALWIVTGGATALLILTLAIPAARRLFELAPLSAADAASIVGVVAGSAFVLEAVRAARRRAFAHGKN
jgi:magnesium-transporting ATPase (P-type)